jgi:RNA polymerase sigma-B factor
MPRARGSQQGSGSRRARSREPDVLFRRYHQDGDMDAREALVEHFLPLARSVAGRYRASSEQFDDLFQVASMALIKAVDGFDPDRGLAFSSYAVPTIIGELKRHFRDTGWALHVPRALQERVLAVERSERELSARLGRAPTVEELARAGGLSAEEVLDALEARAAHDTESIEGARSGADDIPLIDALGDRDERLDLVEERGALSGPMRELTDRERQILKLRFVDDLTQTEIAAEIGVSQMQVSRILRRTLERVRERADAEKHAD